MNKIKLLLIVALCLLPSIVFGAAAGCSTAGGGAGICYVDNTCANNGKGIETTCGAAGGNGPINSLANAGGVTYAAGDQILLKKGLTFYEQLTIPSSGSAGTPIVLSAYGTGEKPIITGEVASPSWAVCNEGTTPACAGTGTKFYVNVGATDPAFIWRTDATGTYLVQENTTSQDVLSNLEWYYSNPYVFMRDDAGTTAPVDTIHIPTRSRCIYASNKTDITIDGLALRYSTSANVETVTTSSGWTIQNSEISHVTNKCLNLAVPASTVVQRNYFHDAMTTLNNCIETVPGGAGDVSTIQENLFLEIMGVHLKVNASTNTGTINFYNNTSVGASGATVYNIPTTNTMNIKNNISLGNGVGTGSGYVYLGTTGGTTNADYNLAVAHGRSTGTGAFSFITDGGHNIWDNPAFPRSNKYGVISFTDDNIFSGSVEQQPIGVYYGVPFTHFVSGVEYTASGWNAAFENWVKDRITDGYLEVGGHTVHHGDWTTDTMLTIQYVGAGAAATLTITGNTMTATVDGTPDANINGLDLTAAAYNTIKKLGDYINALADYTCTYGTATVNDQAVFSTSLADITGVAIKAAPVALLKDAHKYVDQEVTQCKTDLDTALSPYQVLSLAYSGSSPVIGDAKISQVADDSGFTSARTVGDKTVWSAASGVDLFHWDSMSISYLMGSVSYYQLASNMNDTLPAAQHFTNVGTKITYDSADKPYAAASAVFNGTDAYGTAADSDFWNYSGGDWGITFVIKPTDRAAKYVLFSQATDADNFSEVYLDTSGYIHWDVKASGVYVIQAAQTTGAISTSNWTRVTLYQARNRIRLYTSEWDGSLTWSAPVRRINITNNTAYPANYNKKVVLGAFTADDTNFSGFYKGKMSVMSTEKWSWRLSMGVYSTIATWGLVTSVMSHTESAGTSRGFYYPILDALEEFNGGRNSSTSGSVRAMKVRDMVTWLKTNGRAVTDARGGQNKWRYDIPRNSFTDDPHHTSPAIYGGADLSITGGDRRSIPLRNSTTPTIGCVEQYQKVY